MQETGKAVVQFVFLDEFQANESNSISFLTEHLIKDPTEMSVRRGKTGQDANYVFIRNDEDGTLTVFNTLTAQEVAGFTSWVTAEDSSGAGDIRSVAVVDQEIYTLVKREINSSTVYYIEREDEDCNTDSCVRETGLASDTLTGLSHLEGESVAVKADGAFQGYKTVSGGNRGHIEANAVHSLSVKGSITFVTMLHVHSMGSE